MNTSKIMIAVLVLIVVLYSVGIILGRRDSSGETLNTNDATLEGLQNLLARPQPLEAADITLAQPSFCLQGNRLVIPGGNTCTYTVKASTSPFGAAVRRIPISLPAGSSIQVTIEQPNGLKGSQKIPGPSGPDPKKDRLDIRKEGGTLRIGCNSAICVITLQ